MQVPTRIGIVPCATGGRVGDAVILSPWDRLRGSEGLLSVDAAAMGMAEAGLNTAGFVRPEDLDAALRHGLRALVYDPRAYAHDWLRARPSEVDASIRDLVAEVGSHPAALGFYLGDEPCAQEFPGLALAVDALSRYAPGSLAYINLYPSYANAGLQCAKPKSQLGVSTYEEYLDRYMQTVQTPVISYDNYSILSSDNGPVLGPDYFPNLLAVREAALRSGRAFWNVVNSNQLRPYRPEPTPGTLAFQVNTTLAAGGRGVLFYTYYTGDLPGAGQYGAGPLFNFARTRVWSELRALHSSLAPLLPLLPCLSSTGVYFSPGPPEGLLPRLPGRIVVGIDGNRPAMVGEFVHRDGSDWLMVVNLDLNRSGGFRLDLRDDFTWLLQPSADGRFLDPVDPSADLDLAPGAGALMRAVRGR